MIQLIGCFIGVTGFLFALNHYFNGGVCRIRKDLKGKVVFITGANTGIGKETAIQLHRMGATVIIACRDTKKGAAVLDEIKSNGHMIKLDLSDLVQVRSCVEEFKNLGFKKIDILINNAGIMATPKYQLSKQNFEIQLATNHLGHFLLTELLMPYLKSAPGSRVINVASLAHKRAQLDFKDLNCLKWADSMFYARFYCFKTYGNSKLANILHAMQISKHHGVKACSLHPGVVRTELTRNFVDNLALKLIFALVQPLFVLFTKDALQGAQTTLHCALVDIEELKDGGYYSDCALKQPSGVSEELAAMLWERSEELVRPYGGKATQN